MFRRDYSLLDHKSNNNIINISRNKNNKELKNMSLPNIFNNYESKQEECKKKIFILKKPKLLQSKINIINNKNDINKIEENDININLKKTKNKKCVRNNISRIRKIVIKIINKIPNQKYIDDTDIIPNTPYKDYIKRIFCPDWEEAYLDYDISFSEKKKSKSIYEGKNKNKKQPPILGFLQMNENSSNTSLSSAFSEV